MKKIIFALVSIITMQTVLAQKENFSGNWKINIDKSDFGSAPIFVASAELSVKQTADSIFLDGINVDDNGIRKASSGKYALDGNASEKIIRDTVRLIGFFQFLKDKKTLVKNQNYIIASQTEPYRKLQEVWTLSSDKTILTVQQTVAVTNGMGYSVKAVYERQ
jgi:hypothetical protein